MTTNPFDPTTTVQELTYSFDGVFTPAEISEAVTRSQHALEPQATVHKFLPVLIRKYAEELLVAGAQADGRTAKTVPELLFVCVQNAGRSQIAAALAEHLAPGKVHVRSAGSAPTGVLNPLAVQVLAERGIELTDAYPKPLSDSVLHAVDVIVEVGCDDRCPVLPGKRYERWDVSDPDGATLDQVRDIRDDLQARVTALLRDLNL